MLWGQVILFPIAPSGCKTLLDGATAMHANAVSSGVATNDRGGNGGGGAGKRKGKGEWEEEKEEKEEEDPAKSLARLAQARMQGHLDRLYGDGASKK